MKNSRGTVIIITISPVWTQLRTRHADSSRIAASCRRFSFPPRAFHHVGAMIKKYEKDEEFLFVLFVFAPIAVSKFLSRRNCHSAPRAGKGISPAPPALSRPSVVFPN